MKAVKLHGDLTYLSIVVPTMLKYIEAKSGIDIGYAKNHSTVLLTLNNGIELTCHAYETKSMIIIDWSEQCAG